MPLHLGFTILPLQGVSHYPNYIGDGNEVWHLSSPIYLEQLSSNNKFITHIYMKTN
jgi:hypothetical protein